MSKVFQAKYVAKMRREKIASQQIIARLFEKPWVVYAKRPFGKEQSVIEYLGRFTHKIAIFNHRIKKLDYRGATFTYKDYRQNGITKEMTLSEKEFIRRFAQHILPGRFVRIRHYGFLSSTWKWIKLKSLQQEMGIAENPKLPQSKLHRCPYCTVRKLITILTFDSRDPPKENLSALRSYSLNI